jgi:hypothetical protein
LRTNLRIYIYLGLVLILLLACSKKTESSLPPNTETYSSNVEFVKVVFPMLLRGDASIENKIDWESLVVLDVDIGKAYRLTLKEEEKISFRKDYLKQISSILKNYLKDSDQVFRWREWQKRGVIITDFNRGTILVRAEQGKLPQTYVIKTIAVGAMDSRPDQKN